MYLLDGTLTWSEFDYDLPEPIAGHCTVQIDDTTIAFIGGVSNIENIEQNTDRIDNIHVWNDGNWELGPGYVFKNITFNCRSRYLIQ